MQKPNKLTPTMNNAFSHIEALANAGHFVLAMKTLVYAVRVDLTLIRKRKTVQKFNKKLERLEMESFIIESQICQALHPDC